MVALPFAWGKKQKLDTTKCIICQTCSSEPLRQAKTSSVDTLKSSAKQRSSDKVLQRLDQVSTGEMFWHRSCYSSFTSAQNIRYGTCTKESSGRVVDNESSALFVKNRTYKKCKELINVCTFEAFSSIRKAQPKRKGISRCCIFLSA